jgi:cystathionine beta-lyase/cystathionine gamma-synthase
MDITTTLDTLLVHADVDDALEPAVVPPIHQSAPFAAGSAEEFGAMHGTPRSARSYRREGNPTQARLEDVVAAVEGAEAALATASGMGAMTATVLGLLDSGDHVIGQRHMYGGTLSLLQTVAPRLGVRATLVDQTDPAAFARAIRPETKLIMVESPSNPLLQLTDVAAVAALARDHGILTVADNTVATPVNHRPLADGVDLVVHSVTKALSGHADVLAGLVLGPAGLIERIWRAHTVFGAVISPFDAWLALRGLRTLPIRIARLNETALTLARHLAGHPAVARVDYPGLPGHPQHDLAARQMRGYGGLLSFEPHGGAAAAERVYDALRLPARAASLGGVRSLVALPDRMWTNELTGEQRAAAGLPPGLIRYAVGLEGAPDLIADLDHALSQVETTATGGAHT